MEGQNNLAEEPCNPVRKLEADHLSLLFKWCNSCKTVGTGWKDRTIRPQPPCNPVRELDTCHQTQPPCNPVRDTGSLT